MLLFKLAVRNVLRQRRRSILTCMTIAGGYVLCALSFSLVDGSYSNIIRIFTEDDTGHIQIHRENYLDRPKLYLTIDDQPAVRDALAATPSIVAWTPRIHAAALAYGDNAHAPVRIIGIDADRERQTSRLERKLSAGRWPAAAPDADGYFEALIGASAANALKLGVGGELILISQGADGSVANDVFLISGIVGDRRSPERQNVYLPLAAAQSFLALEGRVHEYAILLDDIDQARQVAADLDARLPALSVVPWQVARESFYNAMQADRRGNVFTLGIILFIVFIGVLNTVLMSVLERTREFGVLRAIGSRPTFILQLIMLETSVLAAASLVIGFIIAIPVIAWFTFVGIEMPEPMDMGGVQFQYMTGDMSLPVMVKPVLVIFAYAFMVSILPGIRAARVTPTEAMRSF